MLAPTVSGGAYGIDYNSEASTFAPEKHLVSAIWNWGPYYVEVIKQVRAGTWRSADDWWPIGTGIVGLSPLVHNQSAFSEMDRWASCGHP